MKSNVFQSHNTQTPSASARPARYSGLTGNEMYCAALLGYWPGDLLIGNSVFAIGFLGGIGSSLRAFAGGEVTQITNMVAEGRRLSLERFEKELAHSDGDGASSVASELVFHPGNVEFLTVGSSIHTANSDGSGAGFTTSSDGQEMFCQWDAGYKPLSFVFGNVAYSIGAVKGVLGSFRKLAKGEVKQYSDIFNETRNLALERICKDAAKQGANSVIGIRTTILPIGDSGVQEMAMIGTASYNPQINHIVSPVGGVTTSDLTAQETWNVAKLGYAPMRLVLGTSVYSLGFVGGVKAALKNFVKGEISDLTQMIYGAREESLKRVQEQASAIGADDVLGIKTFIYDLGDGLIEFLALGTAIKRTRGLSTHSKQLPPQAIIRSQDTFVNVSDLSRSSTLQAPKVSTATPS